jgi:hypothetical protein
MTLTVGQLLTLEPPLAKLVKEPMGARAAFRVGHTAKILAPHLEAARESRMSLYRKYGNEEEVGKVVVPDDRLEEFRGQMEILWAERVSVNVKPLRLCDLDEVRSLTGEEFMALGPLIVE